MNKLLITTARAASLVTIALSLVACEPDEGQSALNELSFAGAQAPLDMALMDSFGGGIGDLQPAALPLLAGGGADYGYAPSWDYANDDYFEYGDYVPQDPYDYYAYDDYYDDASYFDQSAGSDDFMWLALAALIAGVIGDSPPDYGFDYGGVQPWAWRTGDGYYRLVEPVYGGNRYYYYEPGAARPFLVRDPYFSYGYRDDRLAALYDIDGRVLGARAAERQRRAAEHYFVRAQDLYRNARRDERTGVYARDWERRRAELAADRRQWHEARAEQAAWRQWDKRYEQGLRKRWQRESAAREEAARQFVSWQRDSYRGPAPRFYAKDGPPRTEERRGFERVALVQPAPAPQRQAEREMRRERIGYERRAERPARPEREQQQRFAVHQQQAQRQAKGERPAAAERQRAAVRQQQAEQRVSAEQQKAQRQAQEQQQRQTQQARAEQQRAQRQAQEQQRQAQQARAEQQRAQRQAQEQQRQVQQARAEQQRAQRQAQEQQRQAQQARAEQQKAQRQAQEQQRQAQQARAQQQQAQRQAQEQRRVAQQVRSQPRQGQPTEAPARETGRGKRDKG